MSIHDNGKLKFVFIAGGPGAGQRYIYDQLFGAKVDARIEDNYFKLISSHALWNELLHAAKISPNMLNVTGEEKARAASLQKVADKLAVKQMEHYIKHQFGMVYDGTGKAPYALADQREALEKNGYDVYVLFVDTPLETLLQRNEQRDKPLPRAAIKSLWQQAKENKRRFKSTFGPAMLVVTHDQSADLPSNIQTAIDKIIAAPLKNRRGQALLQHDKPDDDHIALRALIDKRMVHPQTDGPIQISTALGYAPDSPIRREAEKLLQRAKTRKQ